jgi:hypothetical protein
VSGRVVPPLALVAAGGYDLSVDHQHRAHGHLALGGGQTGLIQGQCHDAVVFTLGDIHALMIQAVQWVHREGRTPKGGAPGVGTDALRALSSAKQREARVPR